MKCLAHEMLPMMGHGVPPRLVWNSNGGQPVLVVEFEQEIPHGGMHVDVQVPIEMVHRQTRCEKLLDLRPHLRLDLRAQPCMEKIPDPRAHWVRPEISDGIHEIGNVSLR